MVAELNPVSNRTAAMLQCIEAMATYALLLGRANHALDHPVFRGPCGAMSSWRKPQPRTKAA